jgi:hypothetical protein
VSSEQDTVARRLLAAARHVADRPAVETRGLWPRAAVLLARQALEVALKTYWSAIAPGVEQASMRAQLLCLGPSLSDDSVGRRANHVWGVLSRASHYHPYDLTPTREELATWCDTVQDVVELTERAWRRA